jgi:hypothetical protein
MSFFLYRLCYEALFLRKTSSVAILAADHAARITMLRPFADWLAGTPLSQLFQNQQWVVPTSQSIHIVCVCLVFTSALMINLRLLGLGSSGRTISQLTRSLVPWMWGGLGVLLLTGAVQTIAEPVRQFVTPAFWAKMCMILIVVGMTTAFARKVRANAARWDAAGTRPIGARAFAIASSILWIAIIVCGRFIAYTSAFYT